MAKNQLDDIRVQHIVDLIGRLPWGSIDAFEAILTRMMDDIDAWRLTKDPAELMRQFQKIVDSFESEDE